MLQRSKNFACSAHTEDKVGVTHREERGLQQHLFLDLIPFELGSRAAVGRMEGGLLSGVWGVVVV